MRRCNVVKWLDYRNSFVPYLIIITHFHPFKFNRMNVNREPSKPFAIGYTSAQLTLNAVVSQNNNKWQWQWH